MSSVLLAVVGGVGASVVAVLFPVAPMLWSRSRVRSASRPDRRRLASIAQVLAGGVLACRWCGGRRRVAGFRGRWGSPVCVLLTAAMLLLTPALMTALVDAVDLVTRNIRSVVPFVAIFDLRDPAARARTIAVAATGAVAVFGSVALQGAHGDLLRGLDRTSSEVAELADLWVIPPGDANLLVTTPVPGADAGRDQRDRPDRRLSWRLPRHRKPASARVRRLPPTDRCRSPGSSCSMVRSTLTASRLRERRLDRRVARSCRVISGLRVGDRFDIADRRLPISLRVAAISTNMGWPPGALVLNADDYARAWGSDDVSALVAQARLPARRRGGGSAGAACRTRRGARRADRRHAASRRDTISRASLARAGVARSGADRGTGAGSAAVLAMAATMARDDLAAASLSRRASKIEGYGRTASCGVRFCSRRRC